MNAIYSHAVKQKSALQKDLARFEADPLGAPISLQGTIAATLVALEKTVRQFREYLVAHSGAPQDEKFEARLVGLQRDLDEFTKRFKALKLQYNDSQQQQRTQLFGKGASTANENPFMDETALNKRGGAGSSQQQQRQEPLPLYQGLEKENSIFQRGNTQLDYILEMGQASLHDIIDQNEILERMQSTMSKSLRTLHVSESTIQSINSRLFKDKLIFWIALILMFTGMYFVYKWFH
ncbi:Bos1p KNAG_0L00140 [Huiozyma naganishii CBS 8797]|uniref:Protein transport protein BOS1 n=1 Tax=Huiozyma naganishii (strain ATCC MYA-139 / BCRC 22969 / CBS 8797 / KCTC 17520 / NBRC 10181 / NCYC 3082 / Yp74L-3) TaxID=1071383 RepID=J7S3I1_HUIN7|nr:hypothetical protein KNAG_0L00140 [Kazachstania naganishii CBS 8797]CCK72637.1 hypothetical protein KNAG_0L00140 [Kazachstania naganishii CBS 8797]